MKLFGVTMVIATCCLVLLNRENLPTLTISAPLKSGDQERQAANANFAPQTASVYVVLSPDCPISNAAIAKLNVLHREFEASGIQVIGIVPGSAATSSECDQYAVNYSAAFPIVHDENHALCEKLRATHTPHAFVVGHNEAILYAGRIDDQYVRVAGGTREVREHSLRNAIQRFIEGDRTTQITTPIGCYIEPRTTPSVAIQPGLTAQPVNTVTFCRDVAPILFNQCSGCHRPGEAAPFSLLTFEDAQQHLKQIVSVVENGLMPPWKPVNGYGSFKGNHRLTLSQIDVIRRWASSGAPMGQLRDLPPGPQFTNGWYLGEPDLVLTMPEEFEVPAAGDDIYQHFVLPTGTTENRLIRAFEFRPGASDVVHHATLYLDNTGQGRKLDEQTAEPGYERVGSPGFVVAGSLGGWGPGGIPRTLPQGMGRPMPANSDVVVQIHYHPAGRLRKDQSRIGLYFADEDAQHLVTEIIVANVDLKIPAGATSHHHHAEWTLPVDTILLDASPHMHNLGSKMQAFARLPNGNTVPLIKIEDWDFYWQDTYTFETPVEIPAGSKIELDCWFDNSASNPLNPNSPPKTVHWGDFSNDEMGICYFRATTNTFKDYVKLNETADEDFQAMWKQYQSAKSGIVESVEANQE